jgi:hypothetical protein
LAENSKVNPLTPFKKCKNCKSVCGPGIEACPECRCSNLDTLTVEELRATADANGKIKAFSTTLPEWPYKGAWQIVSVKKEEELESLP